MSGTIEIDIGGTFTDCYVRTDAGETWCKTRTTPFDLSQGMGQAIEQAARQLELDTAELLERTGIIRYSTTLAMNKLIERKGPRLALITTEGFEDTLLVGRASQWSDGIPFKEQRNIAAAVKPQPLVPKELTVGVKERIDYRGEVLRPLDEGIHEGVLGQLLGQADVVHVAGQPGDEPGELDPEDGLDRRGRIGGRHATDSTTSGSGATPGRRPAGPGPRRR